MQSRMTAAGVEYRRRRARRAACWLAAGLCFVAAWIALSGRQLHVGGRTLQVPGIPLGAASRHPGATAQDVLGKAAASLQDGAAHLQREADRAPELRTRARSDALLQTLKRINRRIGDERQ